MSFTETFKNGLTYWLFAAFCGAVVIGACQYLYPRWAVEGHEGDLAASLISRCQNQTLGNLCLMAGLLFANAIMPGDYLEKIRESPIACALVLVAVVLALGWVNV